MWTRFALKRHFCSKRAFSTNAGCIILKSTQPTTIRIPVKEDQTFDYLVDKNLTVAEFQNDLKINAKDYISKFQIEGKDFMI